MPADLAEKVRLILSQAGEMPCYRLSSPGVRGDPNPIYKPGESVLVSEHVELLHALYVSVPDSERQSFAAALRSNRYAKATGVVAYTLLACGDIPGFAALIEKKNAPLVNAALVVVSEMLVHESHSFSDEDLANLRNALSSALPEPQTTGINAVLDRIAYLRLRKELREGTNPEINTDRRVVSERAAWLGFSPTLEQALAEIDRRITTAADPFDYKACVDLTRTALGEFVEESAKKIESKATKLLSTGLGTSHFGTPLDYLKNTGLISEDERFAVNALYKLLSNESAHKLGSTVELARVSKNQMIEWLLLLSGRVTEYLK
jgi:hypothetical protein